MDSKYNECVGVSDVYYSKVTDSATEYSGTTPILLAPTATIVNTPAINHKTTYYSNVPANDYVSEGATEVEIVVPNVPASIMADILGKDYEVATGRLIDDGSPNPPYCAISFKYNIGMNNYRYYQYLKGTFKGGAEEAESQSEDINEKTYTLTFTALVTTYKFTVDSVLKSVKRIVADDTDAAFVGGASWFSQVQTPLTTSAPDAIALSTIVPADEATEVVASANIVITFNNKIASDYVFVTKLADSSIVSVVKSYDTTGKILTINPAENLTAGAEYQVNVIGLIDVYGQTLAAVTKTFTVAS